MSSNEEEGLFLFTTRTIPFELIELTTMDNKEHHEILCYAVPRWNAWREANPDTSPELYNADLTAKNLAEADLNKADLRNAKLGGAKLDRANLSMADLSKADLNNAFLRRTYCVGAKFLSSNLRCADLSRAQLDGADLSGADLSGAKLGGATLQKVKLVGANLRGADLSAASLWRADLSGADLTKAILDNTSLIETTLNKVNFTGAILNNIDFREAKISETQFGGAHLKGARFGKLDLESVKHLEDAHLQGTDLSESRLSGVEFRGAYLPNTIFRGADLAGADFTRAYLKNADFTRAKLTRAILVEAYLADATLIESDLTRADLRGAILERSNLSGAILNEACIINTNLNGATLSGSQLWETQRAGWSIKGVICTTASWNREGTDITTYAPGEFERLYAEKLRIFVKYPNGISPLEIITLPALIQHLETSWSGCHLRLEAIQDAPGGATATIVVDPTDDISHEQIAQLRIEIQSEAELKSQYLRKALESEKYATWLLKGEVQALERTIDKLLSNARPAFYLEKGNVSMSEFKNTIEGNFQGAMGDNSQAQELTYNQIGNQIEKSMNLTQLAGELSKLRQAMSTDATEPAHYIAVGEVAKAEEAAIAKEPSKVAESLKAAGKWSLDMASKIGASLAAEAIKQSMGMQ